MSVAIDTKILVRFLVDDGSPEFARAAQFVKDNHVLITPTVLLETEWVLRFAIGLTRGQIATAFERLLGLARMTIVQRAMVVQALGAFRGGCDFADGLHLSTASAADGFVTLDRKFARQASALALPPRVQLLTSA